MKKKQIIFAIIVGLICSNFSFAYAEQKNIILPKGTKVEKIGHKHFRFILPEGKTVEVKNFDSRSGTIGDLSYYDKTDSLIDKGVANLKKSEGISKMDYIMIDDEPTYLPAIIEITEPISAANELSPQPDPPGAKLKK